MFLRETNGKVWTHFDTHTHHMDFFSFGAFLDMVAKLMAPLEEHSSKGQGPKQGPMLDDMNMPSPMAKVSMDIFAMGITGHTNTHC